MRRKRKPDPRQDDLFGPPKHPDDPGADRSQARKRRDEKLKQVARNDAFKAACEAFILTLFEAALWIGTGEDLRFKVYPVVGDAKAWDCHHNIWGSFCNDWVRKGILIPLGQHRPMKGAKSNSRMTPVYRSR